MSGTLVLNVSAVALGGRGVVIEGAPGTGKSSLALALIDRGAVLIGDDAVLIERIGDRLLASPPARLAGKLEVRNIGLVDVPVAETVPLDLVLRLDDAAERWIERAEAWPCQGLELPLVRLWPHSPVLPLRAEWALRIYGFRV